ncbi:MAG: matrixin family metalloprotease [Promethearchaeota archaeon]
MLVFSIIVLIVTIAAPNLDAKSVKASRLGNTTVSIPDHAIEVIPGKVFWLGTATEKGRLVEGYAIIHPKKGLARPTGCNNDGKCQGWEDPTCGDCSGGGGTSGTSTCYGFIAKGAKWKTIEDYIVDPANGAGLNDTFISSNLAADIDKWEDAADGTMNDSYIMDIIGDEITGTVDGADLISPDDKNEVLFGDIDDPVAIAVTVVWGIFRGPPAGRELVEWDMVYDDWDFDWSEDCESYDCTNKMDFENIATHELGHTFGLADLYEDACSEETMYGYAVDGETSKRTLEAGDITGVFELYK